MRPRPFVEQEITMKYGAGGRHMRALIEEIFIEDMQDVVVDGIGPTAMDDGAAVRVGDRYLVMTTDSHVIHPLFFPGGDIGRLSVCGTVNDLAMMGATDVVGLTCGIIVEEGIEKEILAKVHASMRAASKEARAPVLTGDTKVMGKGELDGLVINTAGVAFADRVVSDAGLRPGDRILVTGTMGDHGFAVMAKRNGIDVEGRLESDVAPIGELVRLALGAGGDDVVAMKDPTRGGLSSALHEMGEKSGVGILLDEPAVPTTAEVRAVAEILGIDPLHVANEGKAVIGVRPNAADTVLAAVREHPLGRQAAIVGTCLETHEGAVILDTGFGRRMLAEPEGEPLPRIC